MLCKGVVFVENDALIKVANLADGPFRLDFKECEALPGWDRIELFFSSQGATGAWMSAIAPFPLPALICLPVSACRM